MLRMRNLEGDTALHEAVRKRNINLDVVEILTKEDSEYVHPHNNIKETPLFLAAERGHTGLVSKILKNCTSPAYSGPNEKTVLHAAVINDAVVIEDCNSPQECIKILYDWKPSLIKEADAFGWRPLHYAACQRNVSMVKQLLEMDKSVAYLVADKKKTALHIATILGHVDVMDEILSHCPDCWEMNNSKGQNILHIAAEHEREETIKFILKHSFASSLINQKDIDGNTPLHMLAANSSLFEYGLFCHPEVDINACNNNNFSASDIQRENDSSVVHLTRHGGSRNKYKLPPKMKIKASEKKEEEDPMIKKIMDTQLIVATLIATVTFAAGFTVPGGYDGNNGPNQGMAVLARRAAFIAFVVTDSMAMVLSITSVFIHVFAGIHHDEERRERLYKSALLFTIGAMVAMVVAFMTGIYVVLAHSSLGLAITVCLICCFFFYISMVVLWRRCTSDD